MAQKRRYKAKARDEQLAFLVGRYGEKPDKTVYTHAYSPRQALRQLIGRYPGKSIHTIVED